MWKVSFSSVKRLEQRMDEPKSARQKRNTARQSSIVHISEVLYLWAIVHFYSFSSFCTSTLPLCYDPRKPGRDGFAVSLNLTCAIHAYCLCIAAVSQFHLPSPPSHHLATTIYTIHCKPTCTKLAGTRGQEFLQHRLML